MFHRLAALALLTLVSPLAASAGPVVESLRMYAIDCGRIQFDDLGMFSDTGEYDGKTGNLAAPCFLIRHPRGDLLWDAGLGDRLAGKAEGEAVVPGIRFTVGGSLREQLQQLGLTPDDVDYIAFSHLHIDHTGNASDFIKATWLLNRRELAWAESRPMPGVVELEHLRGRKQAKVELIDLDHDVFGDGSVKILRTVGHTTGHQVLQLTLPESGTVILSGDLFHTRENFEQGRVPMFNHSRGETLGSIDRVNRILKRTGGRLVVQHEPKDFEALPRFPAYLE